MFLFHFSVEVDIIRVTPKSGKLIIAYNSPAWLTCVAAGIPGPQVQWRRNGESVSIWNEYTTSSDILSQSQHQFKICSTVIYKCDLVSRLHHFELQSNDH